jgi:two-component system, OmpR family, sensor histidine kinase SenX3
VIGWIVAALVAIGAGIALASAARRARRLSASLATTQAAAEATESARRRTQEFETQLAQALHAMDLGVVVVAEDGTAAFRNRAAEAFVSARHGNALVEAALVDLLEGARRGVIGEREVELIGPPLSSFVIRAYPLLSGDSSQRNGAVALVEESTERRRLDQVRRDFVANISHELRTPIGAVGLLAETIRDESEPEVVDRLSARMISEAERVTATIEDLLELSRIEFGEGMAIGLVPLRDIVAEAVARIGTAAEQHGVSIDTRIAGDPVVRGDRRQLVSAVFNLIDNAVKFSPDHADVIVEVGADGHVAHLSVIDRGIGIPSRDVDRVFERFYRVDRARSRGTGGTGLGLAIVRHVVSNHGGEIRVSSREGEGSTFSLALPIAGADSGPAEQNDGEARPAAVEVNGR